MKKLKVSLLILVLAIFMSCDKEDSNIEKIPSLLNSPETISTGITYTSFKVKGKVITEEAENVTEKGVCWSTNPNPTINDNKLISENNDFDLTINNLITNKTYYFRSYAINQIGVGYGSVQSTQTLSLENTVWKFSSVYSPTNFLIESTINFYADGTTKFDEIGPGQGYFITYGTWTLNGNTLTYKWNSADPNNPEYLYTGTLSGMTMSGIFTHPTIPGTWTAIQL